MLSEQESWRPHPSFTSVRAIGEKIYMEAPKGSALCDRGMILFKFWMQAIYSIGMCQCATLCHESLGGSESSVSKFLFVIGTTEHGLEQSTTSSV